MTGHIKVMLVLQSCTDPLRVLPSSSRETFRTSSAGTHDVGNITFDEDIGIKQEEIPEDVSLFDIKFEPDVVSYVSICMYVIGHILSVSTNVSCVCVSISGQLKQFYCWEIIIFAGMFFWGWCRWEVPY
jgi:hypothetical protein